MVKRFNRKIFSVMVLLLGSLLFIYLQTRTFDIAEADLVYTEGVIQQVFTQRRNKGRDRLYFKIDTLPAKVAIQNGISSAERLSRSFKPGTVLKVGHTSKVTWRNTITAYSLSANGWRVYGLENSAKIYRNQRKVDSWVVIVLSFLAVYFLYKMPRTRRKVQKWQE